MKFQRRTPEPVSLNLTPLIDVVFLLLIFFMVSTTFEQKRVLDLQLPATEHGATEKTPQPLQLEVAADGGVRLNGAQVRDLSEQLQQFLDRHPKPERVLVIADERASHGQVTRVLDQLAGADLTQVSFQTRYAP